MEYLIICRAEQEMILLIFSKENKGNGRQIFVTTTWRFGSLHEVKMKVTTA
jgi:hypothetical protein